MKSPDRFSGPINRLIGALLSLLAGIAWVGTCQSYLDERQFLESAVLTTGVVVGQEKAGTWSTIAYHAKGNARFKFRPQSPTPFANFYIGEELEVIYQPSAPMHALLNRPGHIWEESRGRLCAA